MLNMRIVPVVEKLKKRIYRQFDRIKFNRKPNKQEQLLIEELKEEVKRISHTYLFDSKNATDDWFENQKILADLILTSDPRQFLKWENIEYTMFHGNPAEIEFKSLLNSANWNKWKKCIEEDIIGYPERSYLFANSSGNLIHHAYSLKQLIDKSDLNIQSISSIFEFGGGYGSFCRMTYKNGFKGSYTIFDFPIFNALQKYFLKSTDLPLTIGNSIISPASINNVNLISDINSDHLNFEIFIALWSISESPLPIREKIFSSIKNIKYYLISYADEYAGVDNIEYFKRFQSANTNYHWYNYKIDHIKGSNYLIGIINTIK